MKYTIYVIVILVAAVSCNRPSPTSEAKSPNQPATMCAEPGDSKNDSLEVHVVESISLIPEALGKLERSITTNNQAAQDFFNQGLQLKYAFAVDMAASSFREAQKLDSTCAMCYWGEAWALGSYLNEHMEENKSSLAYDAIQKASELSAHYANDTEQALIDALKVRYIEDYVYDERRVQDSLYVLAMKPVYEEHSDDLDIASIYAEALFLLEPRRGTRDMDNPRLMEIHQVLEKALATDIQHPGACHLYIHSTESTPKPELGAPCASYLGDAVPGTSHINHMPSHTWNEIGSWGKSVRANLQAWHSDQKAEQDRAFAIYPAHNLHMLLYAAAYDGQGAISIQAGKDFAKLTGNNFFHTLTLVRFGRFDEVLEIEDRPEGIIEGSLWDFSQGYSRLKTGEPDFAKLYANRVLAVADTTEAKLRYYEGPTILKVLGNLLEGEIQHETGDLNKAIKYFKKAVAFEDDLPYYEPEPVPFPARHWLGAALLEAGRYNEAEQAYRIELEDHPHNGWALHGLIEALKKQSKKYDDELADLNESWARADIWIDRSYF